MSNTLENLRRKIAGAQQLESVVRTMKAQAAANITQYEMATNALNDYYHTVELGLTACFRQSAPVSADKRAKDGVSAVVFGSDQGLVGQFNDELAEFVHARLDALPGTKTVWAVGERIAGCLSDTGFTVKDTFDVPGAITAVTPLIGKILTECVTNLDQAESSPLLIFYNQPQSGTSYTPICQPLLPLDATWQHTLAKAPWPTKNLPEITGDNPSSLLEVLIREYLFISLFKACAESLASENASRLAAMQRAEKNIDELLKDLNQTSRTLRQSAIDEELFDVLAGYVLSTEEKDRVHKPS